MERYVYTGGIYTTMEEICLDVLGYIKLWRRYVQMCEIYSTMEEICLDV